MIESKIKLRRGVRPQDIQARQQTLGNFLSERKVGPSTRTLIRRLTNLYEKGGDCITWSQDFTDRLCMIALMTRESSLTTNAQNSRSTAFGLLQVINGNWTLTRKVNDRLGGYPLLFKKYIHGTDAWLSYIRAHSLPNNLELFTAKQRSDALNNVNFGVFIYYATMKYADDIARTRCGVTSAHFENRLAHNLFLSVLHHDWIPYLRLCEDVKAFVNKVNPTVGINELANIVKNLRVKNVKEIYDAHVKLTALVTSESLQAVVVTADQYIKVL